LTETNVPTGFNPIAGPITVIIAEGGSVTYQMTGATDPSTATNSVIQVVNNQGSVLPSTGGIGTTIFYAVGGVLVLAAIILLVTKKRMSE
jgi:LPXTG-motif cell wall-anchored protein